MTEPQEPSPGLTKMREKITAAQTFEDIDRLDDWTDRLASEALRRSRVLMGETEATLQALRDSSQGDHSPSPDPK